MQGLHGLLKGQTGPAGIFFILRTYIHDIKVQRNKRIRTAQRTARMTGAGLGSHQNNVPANLLRLIF